MCERQQKREREIEIREWSSFIRLHLELNINTHTGPMALPVDSCSSSLNLYNSDFQDRLILLYSHARC